MSKDIPDKVFYKIGEVAEILGVEQHVLRYWEDEFDMLRPSKNKSGQRLYQKRDLDQAREIHRLLYTEKYTIAGARKKLKDKKRGHTQLQFAFDREKALEWKKKLKRELESLLKQLAD